MVAGHGARGRWPAGFQRHGFAHARLGQWSLASSLTARACPRRYGPCAAVLGDFRLQLSAPGMGATVSDRVGHDKTGVGYKGSVSYNKPVTCVAVIFEHFARRLAKHEYDIVVGRKCRLHRSQPALFWFHSRQFFGRPSSRSSLLWHLAPNCKSTGHVHLRGSRPG